jgi:hypothetical protein
LLPADQEHFDQIPYRLAQNGAQSINVLLITPAKRGGPGHPPEALGALDSRFRGTTDNLLVFNKSISGQPFRLILSRSQSTTESNDITRVLGPVQEARAAPVELLAAVTAAEPAIAFRGGFRPMPDGR